MMFKRQASPEAIERYRADRLALQVIKLELEDMRLRHMRNLTVEKELTRTIRRVNDSIAAIYFLLGDKDVLHM